MFEHDNDDVTTGKKEMSRFIIKKTHIRTYCDRSM